MSLHKISSELTEMPQTISLVVYCDPSPVGIGSQNVESCNDIELEKYRPALKHLFIYYLPV